MPLPHVASFTPTRLRYTSRLDKIIAEEAAVSHIPHNPLMPEAWTDPATGAYMWREERYEFLRNSEAYRNAWEAAFVRLTKKFRKSHLERRGECKLLLLSLFTPLRSPHAQSSLLTIPTFACHQRSTWSEAAFARTRKPSAHSQRPVAMKFSHSSDVGMRPIGGSSSSQAKCSRARLGHGWPSPG